MTVGVIHSNHFVVKGRPLKAKKVLHLLTRLKGRTGRTSARGLDRTDRAQRGPYRKDRGPIFSRYGPEQARLIRDL